MAFSRPPPVGIGIELRMPWESRGQAVETWAARQNDKPSLLKPFGALSIAGLRASREAVRTNEERSLDC